MVFGLFGNNEGKELLKETIRTLEAADQLSEKDRKSVAKYVFAESIKSVQEIEGLPIPSSKVDTRALGISATIPEKIINEIPLPIPLWVICSPSHIKNTVPATIVVTVEILKKNPGLITRSAEDSKPTASPYPCIVASSTVPYLVICVIFCLPISPCDFKFLK